MNYADVEDLIKPWLLTTSVAGLINNKIFMGMPEGSPNPVVVFSRVGGAPSGRGNLAEDHARISFSIYGKNRNEAKAIAKALVSEVESLGITGGYKTDDAILESAESLTWFWSPDGKTSRYIFDALFVAVTNQ